MSKIIEWVHLFYQKVKATNPNYIIIWYDSLTVSGYVDWQGQINDKNKVFTTMSDYFFLDYRWNEDSLKDSEKFTDKSHIMVGIDFFNRGSAYGGQDAYKAGKISIDNGYSEAFFGVAYPYEKNYGLDSFSTFILNDKKIWSDYEDMLLYSKPQTLEIGKYTKVNVTDAMRKLTRPDLFLSLEIKNPKKADVNYFVSFILAHNVNEESFIGCIDSYRRRFIKNPKRCYTKAQDPPVHMLRSTSDVKFLENLFIEAGEIIDKLEGITIVEVYVYTPNDAIDNDISFQNFKIRELVSKSTSLLSTINPKVVKSLPIVSTFNIGEGDQIYYMGSRNRYDRYNYLLDYDINTELSENVAEISNKTRFEKLQHYDVSIEQNDGYIGTSCLKLSANIRKNSILSHGLYNLDITYDTIYVLVIYKINTIKKSHKLFHYNFQLLNNNKYSYKRKSVRCQYCEKIVYNRWKYRLYQYNGVKAGSQFVFYSHIKTASDLISKEFDISIGYIGITEQQPYSQVQIVNSDMAEIIYKARQSILSSGDRMTFDLYLKLERKIDVPKVKAIILLKDGVFLHSVYFIEFTIKNLVFEPNVESTMVLNVVFVTENGEMLPWDNRIEITEDIIQTIQLPANIRKR